MPIYEFQCRQCGHIYETLVMSGDKEPVCCPKCKGRHADRLISRPGSVTKSDSPGPRSSSAGCGGGGFT